jgi:DNA-binding protein H-NS
MGAVQPDQVQNLMQFLQNYSQDPLATWLGLAQSLQEEGVIQNPEFSVEQLQGMIFPQQDPTAGMPGAEEMPPWAQQMAQQLQQMTQAEQARAQQEEQRAAQQEAAMQDQMLTEAKATIREQLKAAGIHSDGLVTDEQLVAGLIAHNGDINQVVQSYSGLRDGFLKEFTTANGQGPRQPTVRGEVPGAPKGTPRPRAGDGFREASIGAAQMLAMGAAASGQE